MAYLRKAHALVAIAIVLKDLHQVLQTLVVVGRLALHEEGLLHCDPGKVLLHNARLDKEPLDRLVVHGPGDLGPGPHIVHLQRNGQGLANVEKAPVPVVRRGNPLDERGLLHHGQVEPVDRVDGQLGVVKGAQPRAIVPVRHVLNPQAAPPVVGVGDQAVPRAQGGAGHVDPADDAALAVAGHVLEGAGLPGRGGATLEAGGPVLALDDADARRQGRQQHQLYHHNCHGVHYGEGGRDFPRYLVFDGTVIKFG